MPFTGPTFQGHDRLAENLLGLHLSVSLGVRVGVFRDISRNCGHIDLKSVG